VEVLAGFGALDLDHADRLTERVLDQPALAVLAAEPPVAGVLEARQSVVVGADAADHLRCQVALRIGALGLDHGADPLDLEALDFLTLRGIHLPAQIHEARVAIRELAQQLVLRAPDQRRQSLGDRRRVVDQEGVRVDGQRVLGHRQLDPVAIEDRAAPGGNGQVLDLLAHGPLGQRPGLDRAEPGSAQGGEREQDQK